MTGNLTITLNAKRFGAVALGTSSDVSRYYINAVHLENQGGKLLAVGTSGHIILYSVVADDGNIADSLPDVAATPTAPITRACAKAKAVSLKLELLGPTLWQWSTLDAAGVPLEMGQCEGLNRNSFPQWRRCIPRATGSLNTIGVSGKLLAILSAAAKLTAAPGVVDRTAFQLTPTDGSDGVLKFTAQDIAGGVMPLRVPKVGWGTGVNIHD